jgi:hypothetical protein
MIISMIAWKEGGALFFTGYAGALSASFCSAFLYVL